MGTCLRSFFGIIYTMQESTDYEDDPPTDVLTAATDPVLAELWDNDEDSVYDDWPDESEKRSG